MILEESSLCGPEDSNYMTINHSSSIPTEKHTSDFIKKSYVTPSLDVRYYPRPPPRSMLEDSDDEDEGGATLPLGEHSRNPSFVEDFLFHDEMDHRDGDDLPDSANEHPQFKNFMYCEPSFTPMCQGEFPKLLGCHGEFPMLPGCHGNTFAEQLDIMTQCRHPLDLFSVFHENDAVGSEPSERLLPGMHFIPRSCEYCGAEDTDRCTSKCQRPKSFFLKKRPPLCPEDATLWDPETSVSIDLAESKSHPQTIGAQPTSVLMDFFR